MKRTQTLYWLSLALVLLLALAACERPAPREEAPVPDEGVAPQPTIVIPTVPPVDAYPMEQGYPAPAEDTAAPGDTGGEQPAAPEAGAPAEGGEAGAPTGEESQPPAAGEQAEQIHVVQQGENLYRIGLIYGITWEELAAYNGIPAPYILYPGDQIRIPPSS